MPSRYWAKHTNNIGYQNGTLQGSTSQLQTIGDYGIELGQLFLCCLKKYYKKGSSQVKKFYCRVQPCARVGPNTVEWKIFKSILKKIMWRRHKKRNWRDQLNKRSYSTFHEIQLREKIEASAQKTIQLFFSLSPPLPPSSVGNARLVNSKKILVRILGYICLK